MFRVIIVDDEPWALRMIEKGFNWSNYGFEIIGKYNNLASAYKGIVMQEPDIVFTDIRIAGESGVDLITSVQKKGLDVEFIIVSGYADFHIAQSAIRLGVFDFLLKPINIDESDSFLEKISDFLKQKSIETRKQFDNQLKDVKVSEFLYSSGIYPDSDILRAITIRDITLFKLIKLGYKSENLIRTGHNKFLFIIGADNYFEINAFKILSEIKNEHCIGISNAFTKDEMIRSVIYESDIMSYQDFIVQKKDIYFFSESNFKETTALAEMILSDSNNPEKDLNIDYIYTSITQRGYNIYDLTQLYNYISASAQWNTQAKAISDYHELYYKFSNLTNMLSYIIDHLHNANLSSNKLEHDYYYKRAVFYIKNNYTNNISLNQIAQLMNISPSYLSEIFSRNSGVTFSKYLSNLRNTRAMSLLKSTTLSIQEIAELSGFNDYYYFSAQFKKNFNISPTEYRKKFVSDSD